MTTIRKSLIALLACGTLALGSIAACAHMQNRSPEKRIEHMKAALNLTDAQVAQITTIYKQNEAAFKADHKAVKDAAKDSDAQKAAREKMKADMGQVQEQVKALLTPDQQAKWQELKAKHEAHEKDHDEQPNK